MMNQMTQKKKHKHKKKHKEGDKGNTLQEQQSEYHLTVISVGYIVYVDVTDKSTSTEGIRTTNPRFECHMCSTN